MIEDYRKFIASRAVSGQRQGFEPKPINAMAKAHQIAALDFALNRGKSAAFLDTGLGKSFIELEFARQCAEETGKPSLILTPLAVAGQMVREGRKFGVDARQIREQSEVGAGVMVANYERLPKLDPDSFGAIVLDESSILKSFGGKTTTLLTEAFRATPYKLAATATPAPNDHMEIGQHSDFLDVMPGPEMLSRWFIADQKKMGAYRLKGHAVENFWQWVASWSRCATLPSDLGGDDTGYILPEIDRHIHEVRADRMVGADEGLLFRIPEMSATSFHHEKRLTLTQRCEKVLKVAFESLCSKLAIAILEMNQCRGNQNTQKTGAQNINPTHQNVKGERRKVGRQNKMQNTCEHITSLTPKNSPIQMKGVNATIELDVIDTQQTLIMQNVHVNQLGAPILQSGEMDDYGLHTEYPNLTMNECSQIRDFLAKFVEQSTEKKEGKCFTSIIAIPTGMLEDCYAQRVTRLLVKCVMMLNGSDQQYDILKAILLDPVLIFCETNDEQDYLEELTRGISLSVRGNQSEDVKEKGILGWCDGVMPWLVSKSSIVGFGMNFQHCNFVIFASINFSYEKFYQAVRRVHRFGQTRAVSCHIVISDTESQVWNIVQRKSFDHDTMKTEMAKAMKSAQSESMLRVAYGERERLQFPEWIKELV